MNFRNYGNVPPGTNNGGGNGQSHDIFSLARQSSVYSLTFDEFQSTRGGSIGKDFGSLNMDELLKTIWSAEESTQQIVGSTTPLQTNGNPSNNLHRQGSLTLPRTLSHKTVDQIWRDLSNKNTSLPTRQQTLGEVTLEEFLFRAGVVREDTKTAVKAQNFDLLGDLTRPVGNQALGFGFEQMENTVFPLPVKEVTTIQQQPQQIFPKQPTLAYQGQPNNFGYPVQTENCAQISGPVIRNGNMGITDPILNGNLVQNSGFGAIGNGVTVATSSPTVSSDGIDNSSLSPAPYMFPGGLRGRRSNNAVEKVIERRQRRMIKNRESAARSRARKQAYTMELEAEIAKLKEENQELQKKQQEIKEMQKKQVVEMMNKQQGGKRRRLTRTLTGPW